MHLNRNVFKCCPLNILCKTDCQWRPSLQCECADYSIEENAYWSERVYSHVFRLLNEYGILMEGMLLKPNMCLPGDSPTDCADTSSIGQSLT